MFRFARPELLWLLMALPLAATLLWVSARRRARLALRFADAATLGLLARSLLTRRRFLRGVMILLALAALVVALARPQGGSEETTQRAQGVDFFVCLDVSRSMLAPADDTGRAGSVSRLDRAKFQLGSLIRRLAGDRIGIIPFAGEAYVYCPMTLDQNVALSFLDEIDIDAVRSQGTDLGVAINVALDSLNKVEGEAGRAILLLTDGEDQGDSALSAAERAAATGVRLYALGVGSELPEPISLGRSGFLRDEEGAIVQTRLDMATLDEIATLTGGLALKAEGSGELQIERLFQELKTLKEATREERTFEVQDEWFPWLLYVALALLALEAVLPERGRMRVPAASEGRFR